MQIARPLLPNRGLHSQSTSSRPQQPVQLVPLPHWAPYAYGKWLADYQNMLPKWNVSWQPIGNVNEAAQNPASYSLNYQLSFCSHCLRHQRMSATLQHQYFTCRVTVRYEKNSSWTKCLGVWKIFTSRFPFYTCNISSKRGTLSPSFKNLLQIFV